MQSPRIFIRYRREDLSGYAGRLYDNVRGHFGCERLVDVDSIEPGVASAQLIDVCGAHASSC